MVANVARKPRLAAAASGCASVTAVVSSMTPCAASTLRAPRRGSRSARRRPYSAFLLPSRIALAAPPIRPPPVATAPARANCDAPVKARRLNTQAWATLIPEPTAAAPKATPDTPTASPSATPSRTGRARARCTGRSSISVTYARLGGQLRQVLNVLAALAVALIGARRHAHHPLEMPGQVGLVGEAGLGRDICGRHAAVEQLPGQPHAQMVHVGVRWQAGLRAERPDQRERVHVKLAGQVIQARRVGQPAGKQVADRA